MDAGLLNGIGQALSGGVSSFRQAQLDAQKRRDDAMNNQIKLLTNNLETDPTTGLLKRDQLGQSEYGNKLKEADLVGSGFDKTSPYSKNTRGLLQGAFDSVNPGSGSAISDEMSQAELSKLTPLIGKDLTATGAAIRNRNTNDRVNRRTGVMEGGLELKKDANAQGVGKAYEANPILNNIKMQRQGLGRVLGILDGEAPVTAQNLAAAQTDYISSIAKGGAATDTKTNREIVHSLPIIMNELSSKFGKVEDLRKDPNALPLINQIRKLVKQVDKDYSDSLAESALNIHDSFKYSTNPEAQRVNQAKLQAYSPEAFNAIYGKKAKGQASSAEIQGLLPKPPAPSTSTQKSAPAVGTIEDGHRFLGGDPADPKRWEAVK